MRIRINNVGRLYIERAGTLKPQVCPRSTNQITCGDWCPLFDDSGLSGETGTKTLTLCEHTYHDGYAEFLDKRKSCK